MFNLHDRLKPVHDVVKLIFIALYLSSITLAAFGFPEINFNNLSLSSIAFLVVVFAVIMFTGYIAGLFVFQLIDSMYENWRD